MICEVDTFSGEAASAVCVHVRKRTCVYLCARTFISCAWPAFKAGQRALRSVCLSILSPMNQTLSGVFAINSGIAPYGACCPAVHLHCGPRPSICIILASSMGVERGPCETTLFAQYGPITHRHNYFNNLSTIFFAKQVSERDRQCEETNLIEGFGFCDRL